ncbi:MAG: flagellar hook assembly protein FlgD [Sphingomonas sp.]
MSTSTFDSTLANLGIGRSGTAATPTVQTQAASQTLGQADFLKLMTAQLKSQDPFNPVDNTQMVAQMAQFSSVAGISQMNTTLSSIADKLGATSTSDALSYVGKNVLTAGNVAYGRSSGGIQGAVQLGADASDVTVAISDANGNLLKTMSLGAQSKGTVSFDWDGTTDAGTAAGSGPFTVNTYAADNGATVSSQALVWAPVAAVSMPSGGEAQLTLPGIGQVPVSDVVEVG